MRRTSPEDLDGEDEDDGSGRSRGRFVAPGNDLSSRVQQNAFSRKGSPNQAEQKYRWNPPGTSAGFDTDWWITMLGALVLVSLTVWIAFCPQEFFMVLSRFWSFLMVNKI